MSQILECLDFLSNMIFASRAALIVVSVGFFFATLAIHISCKVLAVNQVTVRAFSTFSCEPKSSLITWFGWSWGRSCLRHWMSQYPVPLLKLQCMKAWRWSSLTSRGQSLQCGLGTLWLKTLWSLSLVVRRLWSIQNKKLESSESRPGQVLSVQIESQLRLLCNFQPWTW